METKHASGEAVAGVAAGLTGLGILTMVLAPLALPILILTIASVLPLLAVGLVLALPVALIAGLWLVVRRVARRPTRARARSQPLRYPDTKRYPTPGSVMK
jgi:tetrahydromethanopterin S-methyltransferase subunit D